jgi:hypothetical protein
MRDIDRVLGADASERPPMRRLDGALVEVRTQRPIDLHQLVADSANPQSARGDAERLPPPPEPLLVSLTTTTANLLIERFFIWEKVDGNGNFSYNGVLGGGFIDAFMQLDPAESALPLVYSVVTAPLVLVNGEVLDGNGLDRGKGLYYVVEPWLRECVPLTPVDADDVRDAIDYLCNEWLVDVLTDMPGKLAAITACLSMLQRHLLPERPAVGITAGKRGGGKITLAHMLFMAAFGRRASAASWSEHQEERRKALFAHLLAGVAALVWDNIKLGAPLSCPEIEKALTSPTVTDRVLGVSKGATALTTAIQLFVGNNIQFVGDLASRVFEIRLSTDDPRPEDRAVQHGDPIAWTQNSRPRILRALYTILLYGCRNRPAGQVAKTRFKTWWCLVGWPVELAASLLDSPVELDFVQLFKAAEAHDPRAAAVAAALRCLRAEFGSLDRGTVPQAADGFMSRQLREILDAGEQSRRLSATIRDASDLAAIERANALLGVIEGLRDKRHPNPSTRLIGDTLKATVDNPVELDATTVGILRGRISHGENRFHIEVHTATPPPNVESADPERTEPGGQSEHLGQTLSTQEAAAGGQRGLESGLGGQTDHLAQCDLGQHSQHFPEGGWMGGQKNPPADAGEAQPPVEGAADAPFPVSDTPGPAGDTCRPLTGTEQAYIEQTYAEPAPQINDAELNRIAPGGQHDHPARPIAGDPAGIAASPAPSTPASPPSSALEWPLAPESSPHTQPAAPSPSLPAGMPFADNGNNEDL